jgi:hypothetical protein
MKEIITLALILSTLAAGSFVAYATGATPAPAETALAQDSRPAPFDHGMLTMLLERHVKKDRVDYKGLLRDKAMLDAYTKKLSTTAKKTYEGWSKNERFAFWINTYNAYTLELILDHYPIDSINELAKGDVGPWDLPLIPMRAFHPEGKDRDLTLNDIEQRILRPTFEDARLHAAVNCASKGCPPLRNEAFEGARLDKQLDEQMRSFLGDTSRNRFDKAGKRIVLNSIFEWYADDFVNAKRGTTRADFLMRFAPASAGTNPTWIKSSKLTFDNYDWSLNDIDRKK